MINSINFAFLAATPCIFDIIRRNFSVKIICVHMFHEKIWATESATSVVSLTWTNKYFSDCYATTRDKQKEGKVFNCSSASWDRVPWHALFQQLLCQILFTLTEPQLTVACIYIPPFHYIKTFQYIARIFPNSWQLKTMQQSHPLLLALQASFVSIFTLLSLWSKEKDKFLQ